MGQSAEGETYGSPTTVDGILVAHIIGDYFSGKYGVLKQPVRFEIVDGRVAEVRSQNADLATELLAYLDSAENARRVGEFAIGTNVG